MNALPDNVIPLTGPTSPRGGGQLHVDRGDIDDGGHQHGLDDDVLHHVEPGRYEVTYVRHTVVPIYEQRKLRIDFQLLAHPNLVIPRWYRVPHAGRRISAGRSSHLMRDMQAALIRRFRPDRIPISELKGILLLAAVRDVVIDNRQRPLVTINVYSVIDQILGRVK